MVVIILTGIMSIITQRIRLHYAKGAMLQSIGGGYLSLKDMEILRGVVVQVKNKGIPRQLNFP